MGPPNSDAVREHLDKVTDSRAFANSPQLRRLLKLLVEASIASPPRRLNPYAIATLALNRNDHFEPVKSSIVRVELRRFRNALAAYYKGEGRDDRVVFDLPVRQYNLEITDRGVQNDPLPTPAMRQGPDALSDAQDAPRRDTSASPNRKHRPTITIQHEFLPNEPCYPAVSRFIEAAIRFDFFHFRVVTGSEPDSGPRSDYTIRLFSHRDEMSVACRVEITTRSGVLLHYKEIYSRALRRMYRELDMARSDIDAVLIDKEVAIVLDDRGIIPCHYVAGMGNSTALAPLVLRLYRYFCTLERDELDFIHRALPSITAEERHDGYYCVLMASICIDQLWRGDKPEKAMQNAQLWSIRALGALPNSAHATYIRSVVAHFSGRVDEALRLAEIAHAQNPLDSIVAVGLATRQLYFGQRVAAKRALYLAYPHLSTRPQWVSLVICIFAIVEGNDEDLIQAGADVYTDTYPMGVAIRLVRAAVRRDPLEGAKVLGRYACATGEDANALIGRIKPYFGTSMVGQLVLQRIEGAIALALTVPQQHPPLGPTRNQASGTNAKLDIDDNMPINAQ